MISNLSAFSHARHKNVRPLTIALFWLFGLICGYLLACGQSDVFCIMVRSACHYRITVTGIFAALWLPFMIAFFCISIHAPILILPVIFFKALSFSFCSIGIAYAFSDAAWLMRSLVLFSDSIGIIIMILYSLRHCQRFFRSDFKRDSAVFALILLLTGSIDYLIVSPFVVRFMYYL